MPWMMSPSAPCFITRILLAGTVSLLSWGLVLRWN